MNGVALTDLAYRCLASTSIAEKLAVTQQVEQALINSSWELGAHAHQQQLITTPGRPERPVLVPPKKLAARKLHTTEGRAVLLHAVCHIEFNAIHLAWDAVYRFADMPQQFYADWASVAIDEARHFVLLNQRLQELGYQYGDFPAHNSLWEMAQKTSDSCLKRMALVPRVLEARGLDVTPDMITRLRSAGDAASADCLTIILEEEEVRHVAIGSHWFEYCCQQAGVDPQRTFHDLVLEYAYNIVREPFNRPARVQAGFTLEELSQLATINAR